MKKLNQIILCGAVAGLLCFGNSRAAAQGTGGGAAGSDNNPPPGQPGPGPGGPPGFGRGNFDPSQLPKMAADAMRDSFEVSDDAEWNVISDRIQKVVSARMEIGMGGGMGMRNMFRGRGGPDGNNGPRRGPFGNPGPAAEALQKAIDAKAPTADLKAAMARFIEERKAKQTKLEQAQADLKQLLSTRQEAIAYSNGLL
jgi:hypothetical protein